MVTTLHPSKCATETKNFSQANDESSEVLLLFLILFPFFGITISFSVLIHAQIFLTWFILLLFFFSVAAAAAIIGFCMLFEVDGVFSYAHFLFLLHCQSRLVLFVFSVQTHEFYALFRISS